MMIIPAMVMEAIAMVTASAQVQAIPIQPAVETEPIMVECHPMPEDSMVIWVLREAVMEMVMVAVLKAMR